MIDQYLQRLTLVLPTFNRPVLLARFLEYARAQGFEMPILIADGSHDEQAGANAESVASYAGGLYVDYRRFAPEVTVGQRIGLALEDIATPYTLFCADDDFVFLPKVREAVMRLEAEPDCVAVGGPMIVFTEKPAKGAPLRVHVAHDVISPTALQRIDAHMVQYRPTFYSVYRTAAVRAAFGHGGNPFAYWPRLVELTVSAAVVAQGNYRALDGFFGMREMHPAQESKTGGQWMDMIVDRDFSAHLDAAAAHAARIVLEQEEMPFETALTAIKLSFFRFIHNNFGTVLRGTPSPEVPERHATQRAALTPTLQAPPAEIAAALRAVGMLPAVAE